MRKQGHKVSHLHLRYLNPFGPRVGELLRGFKRVLVCELNLGQLRTVLRARFLIDCAGYNKVQGKPFTVAELCEAIGAELA
jgi:2-oxoglutarate ferredoxin oxidoreductase subunit alpha